MTCVSERNMNRVRLVQAVNYMFKVNNRNTRIRCEVCSKLTIKAPNDAWRRSCIFIVNFEHISHLVLVFLLRTLNIKMPAGTGLFLYPLKTKLFSFRIVHSIFQQFSFQQCHQSVSSSLIWYLCILYPVKVLCSLYLLVHDSDQIKVIMLLYLADKKMYKLTSKNIIAICEICSKLMTEQSQYTTVCSLYSF